MADNTPNPVERPQFKIIHIMIAAAVLAIIFAILRSNQRNLATLGGGLLFIYILFIVCCLIYAAIKNDAIQSLLDNPPDNEDLLIDRLESALASLALDTGTTAVAGRFRLMQLYKGRQQYDKAIAHGQRIVRRGGLSHAFESKVHLELAICFDILGCDAEAEAHRQAADECLDNRPEDALGWQAQGELLETQGRFVEAADAYERALDLCPEENKNARDEFLIRLSLATFNAGRPDETIKWADRAIASKVSARRLYTAHRLAAVATINLARVDDSLYHRRRAYDLALDGGGAEEIADSLALVGEVYHLCGDFDQAESYCSQALSLCPDHARLARLIQAIILRARGRSDEAARRMEQAISSATVATGLHDRRRLASLQTWLAVYKAEAGSLAEAWPELRDANAELQKDPKLSLTCEAAWILLLALEGDRSDVLRRATSILSRIEPLGPDLAFRRDALELVGQALFHIGEYEQSQLCWEQFLQGTPHPVSLPIGYYHIGECCRQRGDRAGAIAAFHRATSPGIDSHFAQLAGRQARELSA